jgi:5-methylcytosine-specific restriction endonuclease McrA
MRVLLLNATYEPLKAITLNRAVCLVVASKAEVVEAGDGFIRSNTMQMPVPAVIRLRYYVKVPYKTQVKLTKPALMARDRHHCQYCGAKATTVDHVIPRSRGGRHAWENVVAACQHCNSHKGDHTPQEMGWTLRTKPVAPRGTRWVVIGVATIDPAWQPFLMDPREAVAVAGA